MTNDGGPAFPRDGFAMYETKGNETWVVNNGMSLRDFFAAQALDELIYGGHDIDWDLTKKEADDMAKKCYIVADAMIAERDK